MAGYTVGSLFSGYGGLDLGVMGALGPGDTLFVSDVEKRAVRCPRPQVPGCAKHW